MLYHGDCLDVLPTLPSDSVDMVFADLPYGVTANKWDTVIPFELLWNQLLRIGRVCCAYIFTATHPFANAIINSQPQLFRYDLIWQKTMAVGFFNARAMPLRNHETLLIFYRRRPTYNPQMILGGKPYKSARASKNKFSENYREWSKVKEMTRRDNPTGERFPKSIITFSHAGAKTHPTQKPVALVEWLIKTYTNEGDTVLDPAMGSGTTGVACNNTGRSFIGIEKELKYYDIARERCASSE